MYLIDWRAQARFYLTQLSVQGIVRSGTSPELSKCNDMSYSFPKAAPAGRPRNGCGTVLLAAHSLSLSISMFLQLTRYCLIRRLCLLGVALGCHAHCNFLIENALSVNALFWELPPPPPLNLELLMTKVAVMKST